MKTWLSILSFLVLVSTTFSQEICDNGIDDDLDGLVDLNDTSECNCTIGVLPPILPNPSFEDYSSCPTQASQLSRVNHWRDALASNSPDYFNCGYRLPLIPFPFPHGTGVIGFAVGNGNTKEFFGACLLDTLHPGKTYRIEFDYAQIASITPRPIAVYGSNSCTNLPYPRTPIGGGGTTANCPSYSPNWVTLDTLIPVLNNNSWNTYTFEFSPSIPITTLVFGPSCALLSSPAPQAYYGAMDNLRLSYAAPSVTISSSGHSCQNNLTLRAVFDSIPQSIQWYRNGVALVNDTTSLLSVPAGMTGIFQVKLNFSGGCLLSDSLVVVQPTISAQKDSVGSCANKNDGALSLTRILGGTKPYSFSLNSSGFQSDSSFTNLSPGLYQVTVRDSNLCQLQVPVTINSYPVPVSSFSADTVCFGQPTNFSSTASISSGSIVSWLWDSPINLNGKNSSYVFPQPGAHIASLRTVSDSGCIHDTTATIWVRTLPDMNFTFSPTPVYSYSPVVCFTNTSSPVVSQFWNFGHTDPGNSSYDLSPCPVSFPVQRSEKFSITLTGIDKYGCIDSITKELQIQEDFLVFVPNSFSPNFDGTNDLLFPVLSGIESLDWQIFNRWGELIFETDNLQASWDGVHSGKIVPIGCYPYKMRVKTTKGITKEIVGEITVVK